jgi:hypothetical protein
MVYLYVNYPECNKAVIVKADDEGKAEQLLPSLKEYKRIASLTSGEVSVLSTVQTVVMIP